MKMIDLKFDHVSKRYRVQQETKTEPTRHSLLRKLQLLRQRSEDFWALCDVAFEVERGEVLGIIGHNGAGKSTILKLLAGITSPTSGRIVVNGRLSALIEVGSGFHPELTGRENTYLNGSILGMRRREITAKMDRIIDFAGIRQFIDTPVKRYSSGMYVRLGFAIAAHLNPDILLLDEVLAVGDAAFQAKCFRRINELKEAGTTIIFISHDLDAVDRLCSRVLLMHHGQIVATGQPAEMIKRYGEITRAQSQEAEPTRTGREGDADVIITNCELAGMDGTPRRAFEFGEQTRVKIDVFARRRIEAPLINFGIKRADGVIVCNFNNWYDNFQIEYLEGHCTLEGWLPPLRLIPASYEMHALVWQKTKGPDEADLTGVAPLAAQIFGNFTVRGPALTEGDGVFQEPARKWVFSMSDRKVEYIDIGVSNLNRAFSTLVDEKVAEDVIAQ
jgi:ABC-type polysaccharide/polyol phosphate transport system ATPase subunit